MRIDLNPEYFETLGKNEKIEGIERIINEYRNFDDEGIQFLSDILQQETDDAVLMMIIKAIGIDSQPPVIDTYNAIMNNKEFFPLASVELLTVLFSALFSLDENARKWASDALSKYEGVDCRNSSESDNYFRTVLLDDMRPLYVRWYAAIALVEKGLISSYNTLISATESLLKRIKDKYQSSDEAVIENYSFFLLFERIVECFERSLDKEPPADIVKTFITLASDIHESMNLHSYESDRVLEIIYDLEDYNSTEKGKCAKIIDLAQYREKKRALIDEVSAIEEIEQIELAFRTGTYLDSGNQLSIFTDNRVLKAECQTKLPSFKIFLPDDLDPVDSALLYIMMKDENIAIIDGGLSGSTVEFKFTEKMVININKQHFRLAVIHSGKSMVVTMIYSD